MKLRSINQGKPNTIAMKYMQPGQVGIILEGSHDRSYNGALVACLGSVSIVVVAIDRKNLFWYTGLHDNNIPVQLYESGTILEFEV